MNESPSGGFLLSGRCKGMKSRLKANPSAAKQLQNSMTPHRRTEEDNPASQALAVKCGFKLLKKCRTYCFPFG